MMINCCNLKDGEHKCIDCEKEIECDEFCHTDYLCYDCDYNKDDDDCDFYEEEE